MRLPAFSADFTWTKSSCRVSCRCGDQPGNKKPREIKTQDAPLAQLAEQLTLNQWVPGSSPGGCTNRNPVFMATSQEGGVLLCPSISSGHICALFPRPSVDTAEARRASVHRPPVTVPRQGALALEGIRFMAEARQAGNPGTPGSGRAGPSCRRPGFQLSHRARPG